MLRGGLDGGDQPLAGPGFVQDLLQCGFVRKFIKEFLIFESCLEQGRPFGLSQGAGGITAKQFPGFVLAQRGAHLDSHPGPSRARSSLRHRKSQVYKVLIEPTFNCFWISIKLTPCSLRRNISRHRSPRPFKAASRSSSLSRRTACSSGSGSPPASGRSSSDT